MIEIYGIHLSLLPSKRIMLDMLDRDYGEVWLERHRSIREEKTARAGIAGFLLLQFAGIQGKIEYEPNGRPYFANSDLDFNITHTAQYTFCAIERNTETEKGNVKLGKCRVGLDAENLSRLSSMRICPIADRWFTESEENAFLSDPTDSTFLRIWTKKEALVKWTGEGMEALRRADTDEAPDRYHIAFHHFTVDDTVITLCCDADAEAPKEIRMLSNSELLEWR